MRSDSAGRKSGRVPKRDQQRPIEILVRIPDPPEDGAQVTVTVARAAERDGIDQSDEAPFLVQHQFGRGTPPQRRNHRATAPPAVRRRAAELGGGAATGTGLGLVLQREVRGLPNLPVTVGDLHADIPLSTSFGLIVPLAMVVGRRWWHRWKRGLNMTEE